MTNLTEKIKKTISNNPKMRFIVAGLAFIFVILFVLFIFHKHVSAGSTANSVSVSAVPKNIKSIPAAGDPSSSYVHSQAEENSANSQRALKSGGSAVPTITRSDFMGSLQAFQDGSTASSCQEPGIPKNPDACTVPNLKLARSAGVEAIELRCKGCVCPDIKSAGYTAGQLKKAGYTAKSLRECGYSLQDLIAAGFSASDLKNAGFTAAQLKKAGFTADQLRAAGFTAAQLKKAGFTADQLRAAGFSPAQLAKIGMSKSFDNTGECSVANLKKMRAKGISAAKLKKCGAAALKAAGYSAKDLLAAGFSPKDLLAAGFSPKELHDAGVSAADLLAAGVQPGQLLAAGYSPKELLDAGVTASQLRKAGVSAAALKKAGVSAAALKAAGYTDGDLVRAGFSNSKIHPDSAIQCSVSALQKAKAAGVPASQLKKCGAAALLAAGYTPAELKAAGFTAAQLAKAGLTPAELLAAGFTPAQLAAAGLTECDPANLRKERAEGVSASQLKKCGAAALLAAGYTPTQLRAAGFTPTQLAAAGLTPAQLAAAGFTPAQLAAAGLTECDPATLRKERAEGIPISELKTCGAAALLAAGYTPAELKAAGFTAAQLAAAGLTPAQLEAAGFTPAQLAAAGLTECDPANLRKERAEGVPASQLKKCGAAALLAAGYTPAELKAAGFTAAQLAAAGLTPAQLEAAGFTPAQLAAAGLTECDPANLRKERAEGVPASQLKKCGAAALLAAGYTPTELRAAGFTAAQLAAAGSSSGAMGINDLDDGSSVDGNSSVASINSDPFERKIEKLRKMQDAQMNQAQRLQTINQMRAQMSNLSTQLLNGWGQTTTQVVRQGLKPKKGAGQGGNGSGNGSDTGPVIKAGSIMYAVLITGINSDEKSPIMAKIVTGKLKGSKLIGQFVRENDRVIINFNLINIPSMKTSLPLNAVAIDSNTARTALASHVNHHYLLRYGSLFASSFIAGLGQASQSGKSLVIPGILSWHSKDSLNTSEKLASAAGYTAQQYASVMKDNFSRPPTVKVASGAGLGILFMQDFAITSGQSS